MGRAFEYRKARKFKRWDAMSRQFSRLGKEIVMAVKQGGGADLSANGKLRIVIQNAKAINMPKDRIEAAIKRATSKEEKDYEEVVYEGYAPHGIAVVVECATDNSTRSVANVRMYFTRSGGSLGKTGSLDFLFDRKACFTLSAQQVKLEDVELDLIEFGADDIETEGDDIFVYTRFEDFGKMQKGLEDLKIPVVSAELQRLPQNTTKLSPEATKEVLDLIDKIENDDDVQNVFHNLDMSDVE
ncbi:MAG: YebC/PmpR family DNA-binding transcriptional regulator [Cytophagales bacterium]|nr:MAG: YebC/PmpR family DNA-binding transcriptional regulator [Cytophagales bacterium]TAF60676.1 MAG: YebC/PmpR family DNA-binding transcriptional regulator [Cytophagales bacterium]